MIIMVEPPASDAGSRYLGELAFSCITEGALSPTIIKPNKNKNKTLKRK